MASQKSSMSAAKSLQESFHSTKGSQLAQELDAVKISKEYSFETFPTEIRLKLYRALLRPNKYSYSKKIDINDEGWGPLYPAILRCNKKIHDEAAGVLYGENIFSFSLDGRKHIKLWHSYGGGDKTRISRRYSRLITEVFLDLDLTGDDNNPSPTAVMNAITTLAANVDQAATSLALNDLKLLKIRFRNAYTGGPNNPFPGAWARFQGNPFFGQESLLPLLKIRATRFQVLWTHVGPRMVARLKATIEGVKDAAFFATRQQKERDEESEVEIFEAMEADEDPEDYED